MIDIDKLTVAEIKEISSIAAGCCKPKEANKTPKTPLPFKIGDAILIRTVTMIDVGRVKAIGALRGAPFVVLEDGGWIADTGRFSVTLETGSLSEFERCNLPWFLVWLGSGVDTFPWPHPLPKVTK
jgi:hypothetical protein